VRAPGRIAFWGNFGTRNLGNECTLAAVLHNARVRRPDAAFVCFCTAPADAEKRHGIPCFPLNTSRPGPGPRPPFPVRLVRRLWAELRGWREALAQTRETELLVLTGTGMLTDEGEGPLGLPYDMFRWAVAARLSGCRVVFLSVGVEGLHHPLTRLFIRTALKLASSRSYRDTQSRERLRAAGFSNDADAVYPDLAFSLPEGLLRVPPRQKGQAPRVGLGLYAYRDRGAASVEDLAEYRSYLEKMCQLAVAVGGKGRPLRLLIGDNTYDEPVLRDVRAALAARGFSGTAPEYEDSPAQSFEEVLAQLAAVDVVVASRFHNVLLALLLGRPVVSLSYNPKNDALMAEVGLGAYASGLDALDVSRVLSELQALEKEASSLLPAVAAKAAEYRMALERQYDAVFGPRPAA
jgi:polysaccharide pyruvyl transferase WcaK-like protein